MIRPAFYAKPYEKDLTAQLPLPPLCEIFYSLTEAQIVIEQWRKHYNTIRPHAALNYRPPAPQTFAPLVHHLDEIMPMQ